MSVTVTTYECANCGSVDHDRGANPPAPTSLNCWNCKGKGSMSVAAEGPEDGAE